MTKLIGIHVFDEVEELDVVGPYEVLAAWTLTFPDDGYAVKTFSDDGKAVTAAKGLVLGAQAATGELPPLDVLVYPGGFGTRARLADPAHLEWVRAQRATVPLLTSVCTGALVYGAAGLLDGRPATTHHQNLELLRELAPKADVREGERFVDDGDLVTSAGVSAGIDMALHLVGRLVSPERAAQVRSEIQYEA